MCSGKEREQTVAFANKFFMDAKPLKNLIGLWIGTVYPEAMRDYGQSKVERYFIQ